MPFVDIPKCYEIYVHHKQTPERLREIPHNLLTVTLGDEWAKPRIPIRAEAVLDAFKHLQAPNSRFPGQYFANYFGELKSEWKSLSWTEEPSMAAFVERKMEEAYQDITFPRGNANSINEIFVVGMDYGTVAYQTTKETLQRMMKGINFDILASHSHPK